MDLNKEAEEHSKLHGFSERVIISRNAFIAGANSKYVQAKILKAQIDVLNMSYVDQMLQLMRLEEQLKELEDER
jgi:hypothetical protein